MTQAQTFLQQQVVQLVHGMIWIIDICIQVDQTYKQFCTLHQSKTALQLDHGWLRKSCPTTIWHQPSIDLGTLSANKNIIATRIGLGTFWKITRYHGWSEVKVLESRHWETYQWFLESLRQLTRTCMRISSQNNLCARMEHDMPSSTFS